MKKPKGDAGRKTARRARIAEGVVEGKSIARIAREENLSRQWTSHEVHSAEVQQIITGIVDRRRARVEMLFDQALLAIEASFAARRYGVERAKDENGTSTMSVDLGPDHFAALTGVKRLIELSTAGRGIAKPAESKSAQETVTLEQIERLLHEQRKPQ